MRKFLFILFFTLMFPVVSLIIFQPRDYKYYTNYQTTADSGFDSDYGGSWDGGGGSWDGGDSSWDGGSSWDNDYSSSSSTGSLDAEGWAFLLCFISGTVIICIISRYAINAHEKRKRVEQYLNYTLLNYYSLEPGDGVDSELIQEVYKIYVDIQQAWMNRDLSPIRHLLTDEMYNMYQMQIETLIEDNQMNVMSDFEFVCGRLVSKRTKNNIQTLKVILCVNCKDYIKDINKQKVINGDKKATITYIYELIFVRDMEASKTINCPACGAQVKNQMSAVCPYCKNSLLSTSFDITMSNKSILHQFKRK